MQYRIARFAALTGVTIRALQHYDRMGLLTPARTESGHRVYSDSDRKRMQHILALRTVGMSLQRIAEVLDVPARLPEILQDRRASLEQSRAAIDEAIRTLECLQEATTPVPAGQDDSARESVLDRLAKAVERRAVLETMRGYFSDDAWARWGESYFYDWPSAAWRALFRDVESSLDGDPDSERARDIVTRWTALWRAETGIDPALVRAIHEGCAKAWRARDRWPRVLQRRYAEFRMEAIAKFLGDAAMASWRRDGLVQTYTSGQPIARAASRA